MPSCWKRVRPSSQSAPLKTPRKRPRYGLSSRAWTSRRSRARIRRAKCVSSVRAGSRPLPACRASPQSASIPISSRSLRRRCAGRAVHLASVATAFPSGLSPLDVKLREVRAAREAGADEIDMVIDRNAFLCGDDATVLNEIVAVKAACEGASLKVILEVGELGSYEAIRRACDIALAGGADFLKTSTGKIGISSTPPIALLMCESIRDHFRKTGVRVGLKLDGRHSDGETGIRLHRDRPRDARTAVAGAGAFPHRRILAARRRAPTASQERER